MIHLRIDPIPGKEIKKKKICVLWMETNINFIRRIIIILQKACLSVDDGPDGIQRDKGNADTKVEEGAAAN